MLKQFKNLLSSYEITFSKDFNSAFCNRFHLSYTKDEFENEYLGIDFIHDKKAIYLNLKDVPDSALKVLLLSLCKLFCEKKLEF